MAQREYARRSSKMIVAIDYDGTITSNIEFYKQLSFMLQKSGHVVVVLSGCKPERRTEVEWYLSKLGIFYDEFFSRPDDVQTGPKSIGQWKHDLLKILDVDLWFDNEIKNYEDSGVDFSDLKTEIIKA